MVLVVSPGLQAGRVPLETEDQLVTQDRRE